MILNTELPEVLGTAAGIVEVMEDIIDGEKVEETTQIAPEQTPTESPGDVNSFVKKQRAKAASKKQVSVETKKEETPAVESEPEQPIEAKVTDVKTEETKPIEVLSSLEQKKSEYINLMKEYVELAKTPLSGTVEDFISEEYKKKNPDKEFKDITENDLDALIFKVKTHIASKKREAETNNTQA